MNLVLAIPITVALSWLGSQVWAARRRRAALRDLKQKRPSARPQPQRDPLEGPPPIEPKKLPAFPGPFEPQDPADTIMGAVPVPIDPGTTAEQLAAYDRHLFVSVDCEHVFVGDMWLEHIFLPRAVEMVSKFPDRYVSVPAIVWTLLVAPVAATANAAVDCLRTIPDFQHAELTALGEYGPFTTDHEAYLAAWQEFEQEYPELAALWEQISGALLGHPQIGPVLQAAQDGGA